ncbi:MAG: DUF222 domain-containing protein [Acidimicrobiales bacterium]|nr:DUF222 domain-containing protein [Acidimicrobiales bacterium]
MSHDNEAEHGEGVGDVEGGKRAEHAVLSANAARYAESTPDERLAALEQLAAVLCATHAEILDILAASAAQGDHDLDGATDVAPWLVGRLGLARSNADEWVRAGQALQALPALRGAYARGELSWDQVRPATKFVTPDADTEQAAALPGHSAHQIALMARQARPVPDDEANDAHANRGFRWRRDHRKGGYCYSGFLPFDQGEAVNQAIDSIAENWGPDPEVGRWAPIATRRADALHDLATRKLGSASAPDRATVVIHVDAAVVDGETPGNGFIGDLALCQSGVMRSMCDARVEVALHGPDGATVGVARASQQVPWWQRRQVHGRDICCRGFGCGRKIRQIHHIHHWTDGGETNLDNLVGLCWEHHRLVHEGGWTIEGNPNGEITFISPDGRRRLPSRPQPLHPKVRTQLRRINNGNLRPTPETARRDPRAPRRGPPAAPT